jgi:hypothetical protein
MSPAGRLYLTAAMRAMAEGWSAHLTRRLIVLWLRAINHPDPEGGADALMRAEGNDPFAGAD